MERLSRRAFLQGSGALAVSLVLPGCERGPGQRASYAFFSAGEARWIEAAIARLIPADELGPGALEAGVATYIDRQLAGPYGAGQGMYRAGPWQPGEAEAGYQLAYTPAELFRTALRALDEADPPFDSLEPGEQDAWLTRLESEELDLGGVPSQVFFGQLLTLTNEGFFADPMYGGNRDMIGWRLVGFPGAYANYYEFVDRENVVFDRPPMSIAQHGMTTIHLDG